MKELLDKYCDDCFHLVDTIEGWICTKHVTVKECKNMGKKLPWDRVDPNGTGDLLGRGGQGGR